MVSAMLAYREWQHRKTRIFQLEQNNKIIKDKVELKEHITSCYQIFLGTHEENEYSIIESRVDDITQSLRGGE